MEEETNTELAYVSMSVHYNVGKHHTHFELAGDIETLDAIASVIRDSFVSAIAEENILSTMAGRKAKPHKEH